MILDNQINFFKALIFLLKCQLKILIIFIVLSLGCKSQSHSKEIDQQPLLSVWNSKNASAEQRAEAVNKWVPIGSDGEVVREILGNPPGGWDHFHGPSFDIQGKPEGDINIWRLIYPAQNNVVIILSFNQIASPEFRVVFDRAVVSEKLSIPFSIVE